MRTRRDLVIGVVFIIIVLTLCFLAAFYFASFIFLNFGQPDSLISFLLNVLIGFVFFGTCMSVFRIVHQKRHDHRHDMPQNAILDAMFKISQGDFDVSITTDERDMLSSLAEGVNEMAQKLGSMENLRQDFISNVSHEIQSPLTSIGGFAALLQDNNLTIEQRKHYLDIIETETRRLSKLSDNLLKLSSLEHGAQSLTIAPFALAKQIENAVLMFEPQWAAKNLDLTLSLESVTCYGDEGLLTQVWINLIHNAIKFTPEGGEIHVSLMQTETQVVCDIIDTGIGISAEEQMHVFERFYKADKSRDRSLGGNGLGLSLVKKIVDLHDGAIHVESTVGKGADFRVSLPLVP